LECAHVHGGSAKAERHEERLHNDGRTGNDETANDGKFPRIRVATANREPTTDDANRPEDEPDEHDNAQAERLRRLLESKVAMMIRLNKSRMDYLAKLQEMIDEYNAGSINVETFFKKLVEFSRSLQEEDQRAIKENLSEEELTLFDLLTKPDMKLTKKQEQEVKKVAKELLDTLKLEKLVLDWRKRQQSRAAVRQCIEVILDRLPEPFTTDVYRRKCDSVYQHVYDSYFGQDSSVYATAV
jgi:type I restriction enzyme R subunit